MTSIWLLMFGFHLQLAFGQGLGPVVSIPDGQLRGTVNKTVGDNMTYYAFRGIPYARKPVANLRFAAPVRNDPWIGILNATSDRSPCTQIDTIVGAPGSTVIGSEDCLYINVYTTDVNGSLPVMAWIYGGAFISGSSEYSSFAPDYLIEKNVIFVSFNYRLGVFGFLSTEDTVAPGNWGLKDQILALKWIKNNIQYFGGDPNKITIFGQSAGSASVSYLLQSNLTTGLYNSAILESGSSLCLWSLMQNARRKAFDLGLRLGIVSVSSQNLIGRLREVDSTRLKLAENALSVAAFLTDDILAGLTFAVVQEPVHPGAVFSSKSHQELLNGNFAKVPLVIGFNSNEANVFAPYINLLGPVLFEYQQDVARLSPYDLTHNIRKRLRAGFEISGRYFGTHSIVSQPRNLTKFVSVDQFNRPIREAVNLMSKYTNVYYYMFSYKGLLGNTNFSLDGVGHSEELGYLFSFNNETATAQDKLTRQKFVTLWTNFAKTGNPTPTTSGPNGVLHGVTWEPNTQRTRTNVAVEFLNINNTLSMQENPDQVEWLFYQGIYQTYGDPPYTTY